ncbi:Hypothetical protein FBFL15_1272 [Flavobacterium branchiophilum FL-15]|uniref:Uncharacterized protein n=2 Tax=Flavobacterium branchiophilum TaxID=55197 RepID=G2Z0G4_FLABF|nr:Hypothetical protein FBFL15_1272 [Flavobacterium branchiophilum FL-15]
MEKDALEFTIIRGIIDNAQRKLILKQEFIQFESNDRVSNPYTTFKSNEILEFRYGMKWITFKLTFGREYFIYIKNNQNKIIKINFRTYFGRKKTEYHNLYGNIIQNIIKFYFDNRVVEYIKRYENKEAFTIGEVKFSVDGVTIQVSGIINHSEKMIAWNNIRTKDYISYFSIYSAEDPSKINRGYSYLNDWNTYVLYCVLRSILNSQGIEKWV